MPFQRTLDMSVTREEFLRLLRAAADSIEIDGAVVRWGDVDRRCTVRLVPLSDRRVGALVVPRHRVDITFEGADEEGRAFMDRFHRVFLRGGG